MKNSILYLPVMTATFKPRIQRETQQIKTFDESKNHLDYLPAGIGFIVLLGVLVWIFTSIDPAQVNNFIFPKSFLIISLVIFACFSSGLLFVTLNIRRAVMWAACLTLIIWFQFQHVLDLWVFLYILLPFIVIESILTFLREK